MMEPDDEIAAPSVASLHRELYHYTDLAGLQGIFTTNTMWATHFSYLNDLAEMQALRQPMTDRLSIRIRPSLRKGFSNRTEWRMFENKFNIEKEVETFVNSVFDAAFKLGNLEPLAEPFIASFCTHPRGSYETKNGLLSQWRAYGSIAERYCIVFDSVKLISEIEKEWRRHHWVYMKLTEVEYDSGALDVDKIFPDLFDLYEKYFLDAIKNGLGLVNREMIREFLAAATKFKHRAFREENEVRIIAIPHREDMVEQVRSKDRADERDVKTIKTKRADTDEIPYLVLFESLKTKLPIKRVIIGPSRHQMENLARARAIVGRRCPVHRSETPFVG
jgi:hypothetical protein